MLSEFHYVLYLYDINNSRPGRNIEQYHKECQSWINNIINSVNKMFELYQHEQRVGISSIKTHYLGMDTDRWDPSMIKMFSDDNFFLSARALHFIWIVKIVISNSDDSFPDNIDSYCAVHPKENIQYIIEDNWLRYPSCFKRCSFHNRATRVQFSIPIPHQT